MARKQLIVEDAQIMWRNFSGERFGSGNRDFALKVNPEDVDGLLDDKWPVKTFTPTDGEGNEVDDPIPFMKCKIKYGDYPPEIYLCTSGGPTLLDDSTIDILDSAEIEMIDLIVTQSHWKVNGKEGVAAYVKEMYVSIIESNFAKKYGVHNRAE